MAHPLDPMIAELEHSFPVTRRVIERVPGERLDWRPHAKGMTLGQLASHVATIPLNVARMGLAEPFDLAAVDFSTAQPASVEAILADFDRSVAEAPAVLRSYGAAALDAPFRMVAGDREVLVLPRPVMLRQILLNHLYHHRGQLTTYLRSLGCAVPAVFGNSADDNPFAAAMA